MGTKSYIVRGLGNPASFESASHGAGRRMSRTEARRRFTVADLRDQTEGVECRKDHGVIDEAPKAYKNIDQVMEQQQRPGRGRGRAEAGAVREGVTTRRLHAEASAARSALNPLERTRSDRRGSVTTKVLPTPSWLSTRIDPPRATAISRAMYRPRPRPP